MDDEWYHMNENFTTWMKLHSWLKIIVFIHMVELQPHGLMSSNVVNFHP
jgi:hypothetical protein